MILFFYFILNDMDKDLEDFLNFDLDERSTVYRDGKLYWNVKYFDNPDYNIPDYVFEIRKAEDNFINVEDISADSKFIYFNNIELPRNLKIREVKVAFMGLTKRDSLRAINIFEFGLEEVGDHIYSGKVSVDDITNINNYDVHLKVVYDDDYEIFRFKERLFKKENSEIVDLNKNKDILFYFTSLGNFSITKGYCRNFFDYRADGESMTLIPHTDGAAIYKIAFNYK